MILVFDTETTGLPLKGLPNDHPDQPHLVQIGIIQADLAFIEIQSVSLIVRPDAWTIPENVVKVHGITTDLALAHGVPIAVALAIYTNLRATAQAIVAHNAEFDLHVMAIALARSGRIPAHPGPAVIRCTADLATPVLNLPPTERMLAAGINKPKRPSLKECYRHFFKEDLPGAHDALNDARACLKIYRKLVE